MYVAGTCHVPIKIEALFGHVKVLFAKLACYFLLPPPFLYIYGLSSLT